jgi:hypothetical protein
MIAQCLIECCMASLQVTFSGCINVSMFVLVRSLSRTSIRFVYFSIFSILIN